jgi:pimeloyl-ACP methyl ester carboxylesterase
VIFCGHSLGGTLAQLLALRFVASGVLPGSMVQCRTFGSPPAFSLKGDAQPLLFQPLHMAPSQIRNWCLPYDPVPRYMTHRDLYTQLAMRNQVRHLLVCQLSRMCACWWSIRYCYWCHAFSYCHASTTYRLRSAASVSSAMGV